MAIETNRKQLTLRIPRELWRWIRLYYRARREQEEDAGISVSEPLHFPVQDVVIELVEAGLSRVFPKPTILAEEPEEADTQPGMSGPAPIPGQVISTLGDD